MASSSCARNASSCSDVETGRWRWTMTDSFSMSGVHRSSATSPTGTEHARYGSASSLAVESSPVMTVSDGCRRSYGTAGVAECPSVTPVFRGRDQRPRLLEQRQATVGGLASAGGEADDAFARSVSKLSGGEREALETPDLQDRPLAQTARPSRSAVGGPQTNVPRPHGRR